MTTSLKPIIRIQDVMKATGLSRTHIYRLASDPNSGFPRKVQLGTYAIGWYEHEVENWLSLKKRKAV